MKTEIKEKINKIPLSDSTSMRRTELLAYDLMSLLNEGLRNAPGISLAINDSTDKSDNAQVMVFVRYYNAGVREFCQDLMGVSNLKERTRGEDIYEALKSMLNSRNINAKSIISVTTDGAPSMIGRGRRLTARLKKDNPDMINYRCIIHQSVLCASIRLGQNTLQRYLNTNTKYSGYKVIKYKYKILSENAGKYKIQIL